MRFRHERPEMMLCRIKRRAFSSIVLAITLGLATMALSSSARADADEEPPVAPTGPPPPAPTVVAPAPATPPPAEREVVGPPRPPSDAPLPPEPPEPSDTITPRPIEQPIEPEPELVPPRFGAAGEVVLMSEFGFDVAFTGYSSTSQAKRFGAGIQPAFEIFVVRNLSIGASLYVAYNSNRGYLSDGTLIENNVTSFGAAPRIGYAIPLDRWVTLYPRVAFGVAHSDAKSTVVNGRIAPIGSTVSVYPDNFVPSSAGKTTPYLYVIAPFLIHPSSNFFIGAGPSIYHELSSDKATPLAVDRRTSFSLETVIGGYWGGSPVPPERAGYPLSSAKKPKRYRFGERNDVLLGGDFHLGATTTSYGESNTTYNSVSISPAFDYFVEDHVSVGLGVGFDHSKGTAGSGSTKQTVYASTGAHVLVRVGVQASLAERLSLYPRASFRVGYADITAGTPREETGLQLGLDVPFVFHPAPHFFLGCGPFVAHDVARYYNGQSSEVRGTSGGVSTMLGGWL